ncbi:MAG: hypothetical protein ACJAUL_000555 [Paraglaciecola sp.]|jgi:hypothetical protein
MKDTEQPALTALLWSMRQAKLRKLLQHTSLTLPWLVAIALALNLWSVARLTILLTCLGCLVVSILWAMRSRAYQAITQANLAAHANCQYEQLQESCQLLLVNTATLNITQRLQRRRVGQILRTLLDQHKAALVPAYSFSKGLWATLLLTVCAGLIWQGDLLSPNTLLKPDSPSSPVITPEKLPTSLIKAQVNITAPDYARAKYPPRQQDDLDLRVFTGSRVTWQLTFADPEQQYFIHFANAQPQALVKQHNNHFRFTAKVSLSNVYQLSNQDGLVLGVYSIEVLPDNKPHIRFITPIATISELATDANPVLDSQVLISDDLEVSKIQIVASIAKGSGEGVKFRDQLFEFDRQQLIADQDHYFKHWQLDELGMEPGDELYFSIKVWDNRQPQPQLSRSTTKIIRWLEDSPQRVLSDGTLINFVPEYFKSQRQIIIETEQLIADKARLSTTQFNQMSQQLGQAQSDLKHKYGQFLGDEVDDGAGGHAMEDGLGIPQPHINDGEQGDSKQERDVIGAHAAGGHEHQESAPDNLGADKSGLEAAIAQYGHAHGDADIGNIGQQNPVALMKQAIANMWQAEAQLRQNAPGAALSFENKALEWLNRAKNAERIYVKRLGFEPPPVTEKRRYQGNLEDILSYQRKAQVLPDKSDSQQMATLVQRLNHAHTPLNPGDMELLTAVKKVLNDMLAQRPDLLGDVITMQKMELANSWQPDDCQQCVSKLQAQLWQLLPKVIAPPVPRLLHYSNLSLTIKSYAEFLRQQPKVIYP